MAPSHLPIRLDKTMKKNNRVTHIMNGIVNCMISAGIFNSPKNRGILITAYVLNILEPNTLPIAIACFPFFAAEILTTTSGNDVPSATTVKAIISGRIPRLLDISVMAYIV